MNLIQVFQTMKRFSVLLYGITVPAGIGMDVMFMF